jgi:hypothetical protein
MKLHTIHLKSATQRVTMCPLGDIQWTGDDGDIAYDHLEAHLENCLAQPGPLFVGMGDMIDFASPSMRAALEKNVTYDAAKKVIANASKALVDDLYLRLLKPTRGKWAGLTQGHHHHPVKVSELKDGTAVLEDSDVYLAQRLGAPWLDEMGVIKLVVPGGGVFRILAFHGSGSSVFPWGPLTRLYRLMPSFSVDLLLMGHTTKKTMGEIDRLHFPEDRDDITHQTIKMVGTGGWMKGYINGQRTYVSAAGLSPVALGQPVIHLRPRLRAGRWDAGFTVEA